MTDLPQSAKFWPGGVRERFEERTAMMREANNLDPEKPLPFVLMDAALKEAEGNMKLLEENK